MHRSTSWRCALTRTAAATLGVAALTITGLQAPASAVVTSGGADTASPVCLVPDAPAAADARGGSGVDHRPISAAEQARIEALTTRLAAGERAAAKVIKVPVQVHVMAAKDGTGDITDQQIAEQIQVLNDAYRGATSSAAADTRFRFVLKGTERRYNDTWHADGQSKKYRTQTRKGTKKTLNIWFVGWSDTTLGIATFPWDYKRRGAIDGVRVHYDSVPGGTIANYNLGDTATHEVGHWLGLYHTFQGGCRRKNDLVNDTPAQAVPSEGCPEGSDTCPGKPGLDPIHNFMDYSYDTCMDQFTSGQKSRMRQAWRAFRS